MGQKLNNTDYKDGGLEFAKRIAIHLNSGTLTQNSFDHELSAWTNAQYEETKTQLQIDTSALASNAAQIREVTKAAKEVAPAIEVMNSALASVGLKAVPVDQINA